MTIHQILKNYWQYDSFRPMQEAIIESVLLGQDTLALLPTGGGKSICFQVPAMAKEGICIVISPLVALMKDQVENLRMRGINAIAIVAGMHQREVALALDSCVYGSTKFLYLSPERLLSELVQEHIKHMQVNLFAVDEAHCISQWGYDFRPPYLRIAALRTVHPTVPVLALTATATAAVQDDIQKQLKFRKVNVFRKSFERPNISHVVQHSENKLQKIADIIKRISGSGLVYVRNRKDAFELAKFLNGHGIEADYYHAGLDAEVRSEKQDNWQSNKYRVMVATNAFGMGIDKPDVRFVIHKDIPESLEAYYQEAGRAGRDEKKSYAVLLYNESDRLLLEKKFALSFPSVHEIKKVYHCLGNHLQLAYGAGEGLSFDLDIGDFCTRFGLAISKTLHALKYLEHDGYLVFSESVFAPSRFRFEVAHEALYHFQLEHMSYELFIKTLLRSYGGAFDHYVPVREFDLARRQSVSLEKVITYFKKLQQLGILSYLPNTHHPQVTYVQPRLDQWQLGIDQQYVQERKDVFFKKMSAMLEYAQRITCRSVMILAYFSETNARACGICDVCTRKKRASNQEYILRQISDEVLSALHSRAGTIASLMASLETGTEQERIAAIRLLLDAGKIKTDGEKYYVPY